MDHGGTGQQIGGAVLSVGGGVLAVALLSGTAQVLGAGLLIVVGLWLIVEPAAPWVLPVARERDDLGRRVFRPQVPRLHQTRRIGRRQLRERAEAVAKRLLDLSAEWRLSEPNEDESLDWDELARRSTRHSIERLNRYNADCAAEALALHDEFRRLGITDGKDRWRFEHPTNPLGLERVARDLGLWAKKL